MRKARYLIVIIASCYPLRPACREESGFPTGDGFYQYEPNRSKYPAYHFRMSAHDMVLYGILCLNKGEWED